MNLQFSKSRHLAKISLLGAALALGSMMAFTAAQAATPLSKTVNLKGAHFTVGSKEFTEQKILGQMTMQLLAAAGANITDQTGLAGSNTARTALTSGKIDMYWEYTGTGWISYLKHSGKNVPNPLYPVLAKQDLEKNGIKWMKPAPYSNSYAIAVNQKTAKKYDLKTLSDVTKLLKKHPDVVTMCVGNEFAQRNDGLIGLAKAYGWNLPSNNIKIIQESLVYQQAAAGNRCNFADVFSTDGRIPHLHLVVLKDNLNFFPPYYAALTMREKTFKKYPQLKKLFGPVSKALTMSTMQALNADVDVKGMFPNQVAHKFLVSHNFIPK